MLDLKSGEVSSVLLKQLSGFNKEAEIYEVGTVLSVGDGVARVYGLLNCKASELLEFPHGVYAMSQDIPGLVETSTNLASVKMKPDHIIRIETSQRSSILSARNDMANTVRAVFRLAGAKVTFGEGYPGWKPNPHSAILEVAVESYKRLFGVDAKVKAIHAGLECGLFLDKYPTLDMISFGPTLTGVHSPDERMLIPTVEKFWKHLLDILAHVPAKK